jgi:hypothetical protein
MIMLCVDVQDVYKVFLKNMLLGKTIGVHHIGLWY